MGHIEDKIKEDRKTILPGLFAWLKKYWLLLLILVGTQAGPGIYLQVYLADQPWFCALMCHNMVPHYETFMSTRHAKSNPDMTCMDCHAHPGFFNHLIDHVVAMKFLIPNITKPYLYDHLHVHDNVKGFDHEKWDFRGKSYNEEKEIFKECQKECHRRRVGGSYFMQPPEHGYETLNYNCRRCHGAVAKQGVSNKAKAKALLYKVPEPNPWRYPEPQALPNVHPLHLGMNIRCTACHSRIIHSTQANTASRFYKHTPGMERCFRCHDNKKAPRDNCPACHVNPRDLFAGIKGKGIEETPSPMVEVECTECHQEETNYKIVPSVCVDCHDEDQPQKILELRHEWQTHYKATKKLYVKAKKKVDKWVRAGRSTASINPIFKNAEYNYWYAARDNSRGIHNFEFTDELFASASNGFQECLDLMKR